MPARALKLGPRNTKIITCAAPNAGVAEYVCGVGDKELREAMLDRINFMLSVAEEHGVQTLILGAWGCGVFEWNPETVAELFMEVKGRKYYIRRSWVI